MPANFGLLTDAAKVPMSVQPMQMNTPAVNQGIKYSMEGHKIDTLQKQQAFDEQNQDRPVLRSLLEQEGVDFATPEGTKRLLSMAKGKVSPQTYLGLIDHADKITQVHLRNKQLMSQWTADQTAQYSDALEKLAPQLDSVDEQYEKTKTEKGQVAAEAEYRENLPRVLQAAQGMKLPDGSPLYPPQLIANIHSAPIDMLHGIVAGTKYLGNEAKRRKTELESETLESGAKGFDTVQDQKTGDLYRVNRQNGVTLKLDSQTGQWGVTNGVPAGVTKLGAVPKAEKTQIWEDSKGELYQILPNGTDVLKNGTEVIKLKDMPGDVKKLGDKNAGPAAEGSTLKPETLDFLNRYYVTTGKKYEVPAFGIGNNVARAQYLNAAAQLAQENGYSPEEMGTAARMRDINRLAIANLQKQNAIIKSGENDLVNVMQIMKDELAKIGGPDSPKVRAIWNKAVTDWKGDPTFSGFNAAYANFLDVAAKTLSGQSGAAGTPVSYLELAKKQLGDNPNMKQLAEIDKAMTSLFDARQRGVEKTIGQMIHASDLVPKSGSPAAERGAETKVTPAQQAANDADRPKLYKKEFSDTQAVFKSAGTPEAKDRAWSDMKGLAREMKKVGALQEISNADIAAGKLQPGDVSNGYIFRGGVNKKENWEKL